MHLYESIASAYKPMQGNRISNAIKSIKSKSSKNGSVLSKRSNNSVLNNYDADAIKEETVDETPNYVTDQNGSRVKLNGTEFSSPLLGGSPQKID